MGEPVRCPWCLGSADYIRYHDEEWGRPKQSDQELYERLCLEGFQAGLAWITVLRKREAFRELFLDFDPEQVARFGPREVKRLMQDARIIRSQPKIEAAIQNARATLELVAKEGSLAKVLHEHAPKKHRAPRRLSDIPALLPETEALSKRLKKEGFRFVGPTTLYALFQATGVVNDHLVGCHVRAEVEREHARSR